MRQTTDTCRYRRTIPVVMVALFLLAGVASAGCGVADPSTALPTPDQDVGADGTINRTGTSSVGSRSSTTKSPSRTATTSPGSVNGASAGDKGGEPSKGGDAATPGSGPAAGNPSFTNGPSSMNGPGTTRPRTQATDGSTKPRPDSETRPGGSRPYPGLPADPGGTIVASGRGPGPGPVIVPSEKLVEHYDRIYAALPVSSAEVNRQTEDVVRLAREAPPDSQQAATGDAGILVAAAEEVKRTGNVATYEKPEVRAAYQNMKAQQAQVPAGVR